MASRSVFINDLDDFIAPSQACVNPLVSQRLSAATDSQADTIKTNSRKHGRVTLELDYSEADIQDAAKSEMNLIKTKSNDTKKIATVSLNDCLACSGCVTSAETVLIQEQSIEKFYSILDEKDNDIIVVQISPNSITSIADFLNLTYSDMFLHIAGILKSIGVHYVLDSSSGADVALIETKEELLYRMKIGAKREWPKNAPQSTVAQSSTSVMVYETPDNSSNVSYKEEKLPQLYNQLPLLSAHCPGWVCYAEKTAPQVLPFLSTAKSAQQIVGSLVKSMLLTSAQTKSAQDDKSMDISDSLVSCLEGLSISELSLDDRKATADNSTKKVTVVSVQPCFDKKLEASRKDFYHSNSELNEVDIVISTTELWQIMDSACLQWSERLNGTHSDTSTAKVTMQVDLDDDNDNDDDEEYNPAKKSRGGTAEWSGAADMDMSVATDSLTSPGASAPSPSHRLSIIKQNFAHVYSYMEQVPPDRVHGVDNIERLFRSFSSDGRRVLAASERNMSSGGYAEYIFRSAMHQLYSIDLWNVALVYKQGRNADMQEIDTEAMVTQLVGAGQLPPNTPIPRLSVAKAYGFRNIQTVLNRMKRQSCEFDFIEVMACPSGCSNGGGQLKSLTSILPHSSAMTTTATSRAESPAESKHRIVTLERLFHDSLALQQPEDSALARYVYDKKRLGQPLSETALQLLHTRYHAVPKLETIAPLAVKW